MEILPAVDIGVVSRYDGGDESIQRDEVWMVGGLASNEHGLTRWGDRVCYALCVNQRAGAWLSVA